MKSVLATFLLLLLCSCASLERRSRTELVGDWRYVDASQRCDYSFKPDGSFNGEVRLKAKLVSKFSGKWKISRTALLYTYTADALGRIPPGTTDQDQLLEIHKDSFVIQAANGDQRRYRRIR